MKKVKINNEGFSLVELIIVIAIMAILAGALAPQLIKYIDNSRKSTDVSTGQTIATAVGAALANEKAYAAATGGITAGNTRSFWISNCRDVSEAGDFEKKVGEIIGAVAPTPKYRGTVGTDDYNDFAIVISKDTSNNVSFEIYPAFNGTDAEGAVEFDPTGKADDIVYPTVGANYAD